MKLTVIISGLLSLTLLLVSFHLPAQGEKEKKTVKLSLTYIKINNEAPILKVETKIKDGKRFEPVEGVEVMLSSMEETSGDFIGSVITNHGGIASLALPAAIVARLDSISPVKFSASIASDRRFNDVKSEIEITKARIELSLTESDSVKSVAAKVLALADGKWVEIPDIETKLFIKRLFSDLAIGENAYTTDKAGEVSTTFNITIPGDPVGNIYIGAKLDDNDTYGTVIATKIIRWGVPLKVDNSFAERSLWATRDKTPLWLLIFPNIAISIVWGFIFYLLYLILRIRKIGLAGK